MMFDGQAAASLAEIEVIAGGEAGPTATPTMTPTP